MDIKELRRLVAQRHAAATDKVSRLRRSKGVDIGGTNYDVRRDPSNIKRYTRAQLNSYLSQLNQFTSRSHQFYAGAEGQILPGDKVRELQREITRYNAKGRARDAKLANITLPGQDLTIAQRAQLMNPSVIRAGGLTSARPLAEARFKPSGINGVDALNKLIESFRRKNQRDYLPKAIASQRDNAEKLLVSTGMTKFQDELRGLSDYQFDVMWNETSLPSGLGMGSAQAKMASEGRKNAAHEAVLENLESDLAEHIAWAKTLQPQTGKPKRRK